MGKYTLIHFPTKLVSSDLSFLSAELCSRVFHRKYEIDIMYSVIALQLWLRQSDQTAFGWEVTARAKALENCTREEEERRNSMVMEKKTLLNKKCDQQQKLNGYNGVWKGGSGWQKKNQKGGILLKGHGWGKDGIRQQQQLSDVWVQLCTYAACHNFISACLRSCYKRLTCVRCCRCEKRILFALCVPIQYFPHPFFFLWSIQTGWSKKNFHFSRMLAKRDLNLVRFVSLEMHLIPFTVMIIDKV